MAHRRGNDSGKRRHVRDLEIGFALLLIRCGSGNCRRISATTRQIEALSRHTRLES